MIILPPPMLYGGESVKLRHVVSAVLCVALTFWFTLCIFRWLSPSIWEQPRTLLEIILADLQYLSTKRLW